MSSEWNAEEFKNELIKLRESLHIKKHPIFDLWSQGKLSKQDMAQYVLQHSLWSSQVVNLWGIVVAKAKEQDVQNFFLENMAEEHGLVSEGGRTSTPHIEMQKKFARACGISEDKINNIEPTAGCLAMISFHWHIALGRTWQEYVAASVVGNESMEVGIMGRILPSLYNYYGYKKGSSEIEFFEEHYLADQEHGNRGITALAEYTHERELQEKCLEVVRNAVKIRWLSLDELLHGIKIN
ncbi:iron-containing redox enzyme family protein [Acidiplasma sp.]|uniref:TenA family transcriptional regulator n=1 Tax=Acidiplasma sp. TaxID=1872114 RepID=UPI0025837E29|nr:iron-containing redox enzyme family protein [Acidiplasma sp.]